MQCHDDAVKRIVRYLIGTKDEGKYFGYKTDFWLEAYVYVDFASLWGIKEPKDPTCVKSCTGYLICLGVCPIIWRSKLQTLISVSTMDAEYIALLMCMRKLILLKQIFVDPSNFFEVDVEVARAKCTVVEDNSLVIQLENLPKMTPKSKHISLHYHFYWEHIRKGSASVEHISTYLQIANTFTKCLAEAKFEVLHKLLMNW